MLKKILLALGFAAALGGAALAQSYVTGAIVITSFSGHFSVPIQSTGPQATIALMSGGTFTCAASAATVADAYMNAGSQVWMTVKTPGGTVAAPVVATVTPGTGFTVTCGGSDTSVYNYVIIG
jgi:hypothetical protein